MKTIAVDIAISLLLLLGIIWYIQQDQPSDVLIELSDYNGASIQLQDPSIILFWATWSKPSQRDLQVLKRFHKKYPNQQVLGVYSNLDSPESVQRLQSSLDIQYPLVTTTVFPEHIPLTIIIKDQQQIILQESLDYQKLISLLDLNF